MNLFNLTELYWLAVVLTGNLRSAERVVVEALGECGEEDRVSGQAARRLVIRAAARVALVDPDEPTAGVALALGLATLPLLERLRRMGPVPRVVFVARCCERVGAEELSRWFRWPVSAIEEAFMMAARQLACGNS
ncbi:MAG: hypothetical protein ABI693_35000 [Bryobacteraceae bacterium]